jgi:cell division protein FtsB
MRERGWMGVVSVVLLGATLVFVPLRIFNELGVPRYRALSRELVRVEEENERLAREVKDLKQETELLRNDPRAIERLARDELGMVREGEVVFQFPN